MKLIPTKVCLLVRVSSDSDRQDYTRQISDLTKVAERNGWEIVSIIKAKVSATKTRLAARKDVAELFDLVSKHLIQKVLVTEITRIGRKAKEIREIVEFLEAHNTALYIESSGLDTGSDNPMQKAITNIFISMLSEFAELETARLSQRIKSGMKEAKKQGRKAGRRKGSTDNLPEKIKTNPKYKTAAKKLKEGLSLRDTAAAAGVSVNTVRRIKAAL